MPELSVCNELSCDTLWTFVVLQAHFPAVVLISSSQSAKWYL